MITRELHRPGLLAAAVYLLDEVSQMVGSHSDAVNSAVDHLVRRLNNKAPTVKQKVGGKG